MWTPNSGQQSINTETQPMNRPAASRTTMFRPKTSLPRLHLKQKSIKQMQQIINQFNVLTGVHPRIWTQVHSTSGSPAKPEHRVTLVTCAVCSSVGTKDVAAKGGEYALSMERFSALACQYSVKLYVATEKRRKTVPCTKALPRSSIRSGALPAQRTR